MSSCGFFRFSPWYEQGTGSWAIANGVCVFEGGGKALAAPMGERGGQEVDVDGEQ